MTSTTTSPKATETRWQRFLGWFRTIDEAFEFDPWEHENRRLKARLAAMEETVRELDSRVGEAVDKGSCTSGSGC